MPTVTLRPALPSDAPLLFAWQQHPSTREHARNSEPPEWETHLAWLDRVLIDSTRHLLIAEEDGLAVGMLRLDINTEDAEVSILVAPGLRQRHIGTAMLTLARQQFPHLCFAAYIIPSNVASGRLFQSAGYVTSFDGWWTLDARQEAAA